MVADHQGGECEGGLTRFFSLRLLPEGEEQQSSPFYSLF